MLTFIDDKPLKAGLLLRGFTVLERFSACISHYLSLSDYLGVSYSDLYYLFPNCSLIL